MKLGKKILELRKKKGLSQEQLGEKVNVTRQTISNWELQETAPNPDQLKLLSKALNISIDELLDNDIQNVVVEKVSNTEKLAGLVLKILKFLGIIFIIVLVIDVISLIIFSTSGRFVEYHGASTICEIEDKEYEIEFGTDKKFSCKNCSNEMKEQIKEIIDFNDIDNSMVNIENYFISNNGTCN